MNGLCLLRSCGLGVTAGFLRDGLLWALLLAGALLALGAGYAYPALFPSVPASGAWLVGLALWQPLTEEIVFRGILQNALGDMTRHKSWHRLTAANLIQALAFALSHTIHHPTAWALAMIPTGLVFGYLRERHHHIGGAFLTHAIWNLMYFWALPTVLS